MVHIARFRSTWGIEPGENYDVWKPLFIEWKNHGYEGVEFVIYGQTEDELRHIKGYCNDIGLKISITIFSAWQRYRGPRPRGLLPDVHLEGYREQLRLAQILDPVRINAQSGADFWTWDQAVYFFQNTLKIDKEMGFEGRVCHETHRNRGLFNPYVTDYVLQRVPELRITGDFSHWVVVCERLLDTNEEDQELLDRVIPHVYHIHARIGTTQSSQCPEPTNPVFKAEREFFERLWLRVIKSRAESDEHSNITFVPEYGLYPYHPFGSIKPSSEIADEEGVRLQILFQKALDN